MFKWSPGHHCPMCGGDTVIELETNKRFSWIPFKRYYTCETCYAEYLVILHQLLWQFERPNTLYLYKDF